jgi:hypothetical protein
LKTISPERLLSKFLVDDGCWPWTAARDPNGYGRIQSDNRGGTVLAHRAVWEMLRGPVPDGMCLCHTCDNPSCVRPGHVFVGTMKDNLSDMARKGRSGMKKLNPDQVRRVRRLLALGVHQRTIAKELGVAQSQISSIKARRTWTWVP